MPPVPCRQIEDPSQNVSKVFCNLKLLFFNKICAEGLSLLEGATTENDIIGGDPQVEPRLGDPENLGETGTAANESSSVLQERANVTTAELASSPGANASITNDPSSIEQSEPQLEIPKEENTTAIAMEGQGLTNTTIEGQGEINTTISGKKGW